jgi:hypothetical protein
MIRNKNQFLLNSEISHINTRQHANLHQPSVNVSKYQKGVYCVGVKVFNMLSFHIKTESDNPKKLKVVLQNFLHKNSFCSMDEYFVTSKKVKYLHMISDRHIKVLACMPLFLFTNLYHVFVCIYNSHSSAFG